MFHSSIRRLPSATYLFLHADFFPTREAITSIQQSLSDPGFRIVLFRLRFDNDRLIYRIYAFLPDSIQSGRRSEIRGL
ncbi:MAG: hypothetical protein J4G05_10760 [Chlorobi bacterium]|nr:hypothetical protein [Chlorobiota bacterium]